MKRLGIEPRRFVEEPLPRLSHVLAAEHRLRVEAVHYVANPDLDAAVPKGGRRPHSIG